MNQCKAKSAASLFSRAMAALGFLLLASSGHVLGAQDKPPAKPVEKNSQQPASAEPQLPAQFTLLETRVRFEANGDSRKEVHAIVKINNELGVNQFARLNFDYNRSFQNVEIPFVRITHSSGGTADILPSAIADNPNPAVVNFPAYQDVRVKSVRILGLAPGDTLEYRVITTVSHHPLAPDFWFEHTFDRTGVVMHEDLTLELPPGRGYVQVNPETPAEIISPPDGGYTYRWQRKQKASTSRSSSDERQAADVSASTFATEVELSASLARLLYPDAAPDPAVEAKARALTDGAKNSEERLRALYAFVSRDIATVDLPVGATGLRIMAPKKILSSGAATAEDKAALLVALVARIENFTPAVCFSFLNEPTPPFYSLPADFQHVLLGVPEGVLAKSVWMDPASEVAPFGMVSRAYRGKTVLCPAKSEVGNGLALWEQVPDELPFAASQSVSVDAALTKSGSLTAKVRYILRGDNELVLRLAFHQTPKEKWKDVAQLLALSDGYRGKIVSATASDPYATKEPFTVEYEIEQLKFVDWSKKPIRIPALLPLLGLPDPPAAGSPIQLGTPLDVQTTVTLHLPPGTTARVPAGTSVERDYATFSSQYAAHENTVTASRHIHFLLREVPATRAVDYNAFLHAVQSDQTQLFTLDRPSTPAPAPSPQPPTTSHSYSPATISKQ